MEQGKGMLESLSDATRSMFSRDAARKMAEYYIEAGEKFATGALEFQAKASKWAKDTPLQALLEAQNSMGRKTSGAFGQRGSAPVANRGGTSAA
jgi:hypothetical protein